MGVDVYTVSGQGAEDVLVATAGLDEGAVFTGTEDGGIHRVSHDGRKAVRVADTFGRPLGLEWLPDGRLLVCDARRGLLACDVRTGRVEPFLTEVDGRPMVFCNNAAVADDGTVYFSDSSTVHPIDRWKAEVLELTGTGRLLRRRPDGEVDVLLGGLQFANGVALSADGSWVAVAETSLGRVQRVFVSGERAGESEVYVAALPGFPDNISRGSDGLVWVTIASPSDPLVARLQQAPMWVRRGVTRLPDAVQPAPKRTIRVQAYDDAGALVHDVDVRDAESLERFHMPTGVREHEGRVWLGSLHEPAVAVVEIP